MPHPFAVAQLTRQQQTVQDLQGAIFKWALVFLAILIVLWLVAWALRRRTQADADVSGAPTFSLSDLRAMLADGRLTQEEFDKARDRIVGAARRQLGVAESPDDGVVLTDDTGAATAAAPDASEKKTEDLGPELLPPDNGPHADDDAGSGEAGGADGPPPPSDSDESGPETRPPS